MQLAKCDILVGFPNPVTYLQSYEYLSLSMIVLNSSRDWQGINGFPCLKNKPHKIVSFKIISFYWYEAIGTINPFKQPKRALELKLSNFKNFVNCKHFVCLPACLPACPPARPPAWLQQSTYHLDYWAYSLHSFPVQSVFPSTQTFLIFVAFTFVFCKSGLSCVFCMISTIEKGC